MIFFRKYSVFFISCLYWLRLELTLENRIKIDRISLCGHSLKTVETGSKELPNFDVLPSELIEEIFSRLSCVQLRQIEDFKPGIHKESSLIAAKFQRHICTEESSFKRLVNNALNVYRLDLRGNVLAIFTNVDARNVFSNLQDLVVQGIEGQSDIDVAPIGMLTQLISLTLLSYSNWLNLESLQHLKKLRELNIKMCQDNDLSFLSHLHSLEKLVLSGSFRNQWPQIWPPLEKVEITCTVYKGTDLQFLKTINDLPSLKEFTLTLRFPVGIDLDLSVLSELSHLKKLTFRLPLNSSLLAYPTFPDSLTHLYVDLNRNGMASFKESLINVPNVKIFVRGREGLPSTSDFWESVHSHVEQIPDDRGVHF